MHPAVKIGQAEIGRVERGQNSLTLRRRLTERPRVMLLVSGDRLPKQIRQRREIVTAARDELSLVRVRHRHADIALTKSLRIELPPADPLQVVAAKPQTATANVRVDAGVNALAKNDVDSQRLFSLASRFQHKSPTGTKSRFTSPADGDGVAIRKPGKVGRRRLCRRTGEGARIQNSEEPNP